MMLSRVWYALVALGVSMPVMAGGLVCPVGDCSRTSALFSSGAGVTGYPHSHHGVDFPVAVGTPVIAAAGGTVEVVDEGGFRGRYVAIRHAGTLQTLYTHLSEVSVAVGQQVTQGEQIGLSGDTGAATGPHLHFGVYEGEQAVDPLGYLQ